ncbi:uracil-DNA glycosylase [Nitratifractor sp.]|uniref:uracil-DNA glycosylase family protein n=1 Tax=Nitratifractor sp. TaxID=2268144 RepID=UPI0025DBB964|nr:uracil-DNA glycosylase [Nitratifractor sp.]
MKELLRLNGVSESWNPILLPALEALDSDYRDWIVRGEGYIPRRERLLAAFSTLQPEDLRYILFGQDPYPRQESAVGYAFIDGRVKRLFSETGLSREVNRATSLRNFVKMALAAEGALDCGDLSQEAIARLDKTPYIDSIGELRRNFERRGVLLLNTALLFSSKEESKRHIKAWRGFVERLLAGLVSYRSTLILFGAHAKALKKLEGAEEFEAVELEHPYNASFVCNSEAWELFGPMQLLRRPEKE